MVAQTEIEGTTAARAEGRLLSPRETSQLGDRDDRPREVVERSIQSPGWGSPRVGLLATREAPDLPGLRFGVHRGLCFQEGQGGPWGGVLTVVLRYFKPLDV